MTPIAPPSTLTGRNPEYELLAWALYNVNDADAWAEFVSNHDPDHYINAGCREIARVMVETKTIHRVVDAPMICREIASDDAAFAMRELISEANGAYWGPGDYPVRAIRYWQYQVALAAYQRQASGKMQALMGKCADGSLTPEELDTHWRDIRAYAKLNERLTITARQATLDAIDEIETAAGGESEPLVSTGITALDEATNGFERGELWVIGARPSQGKTALAIQMLRAATIDHPGAIVSLETTAVRLMQRWIAGANEINFTRMRSGSITQGEQIRIIETCQDIAERRVNILDKPGASLAEIEAWMDAQAETSRPRITVVDYLTLIEKNDSRRDLREHVDDIVKLMKAHALRTRSTVVLLAQLNRGTNEDARPTMSRLKESGGIEQAADKILLIHRPNKDAPGVDSEQCELILAKQRDGQTGIIEAQFHRQTMTFQ